MSTNDCIQELYNHISDLREELKQVWILLRNLEKKQEQHLTKYSQEDLP